ncbi:MAG: tetratricopeptide repeat protein [Pyrinomonadaceae bacterium]|nr:tetratricopeptide repeat protein [Pyrinomonadaceae bacterium]
MIKNLIALLFILTLFIQVNQAQDDKKQTSGDKPPVLSVSPPKKDNENAEAVKFRDLGVEYSLKFDYLNAIINLNKAIEIDPKFADAYNRRGAAYSGIEKHDLAIADFTKALELDPKFEIALLNRGVEYMLKEDYKSAIKDFTKGIEINRENFFFYSVRASAYEAIGQKELAAEDSKKMREILSKP